jgi:hypothetical protein
VRYGNDLQPDREAVEQAGKDPDIQTIDILAAK